MQKLLWKLSMFSKTYRLNDGRRLTCPNIHQLHSSLVQENCWENKPYTPFKFMMICSLLVVLLLMQPQERYMSVLVLFQSIFSCRTNFFLQLIQDIFTFLQNGGGIAINWTRRPSCSHQQ